MKKSIIGMAIIVSIISFLLSGCGFKEVCFNDIEVGQIFAGSRDGYYEKLPHNYCLDIDLRTTTRLFKVADEFLNTPWDSAVQHEEFILKGHYIKGYYNNDYLILCEEKPDDSCIYLSFDFFSNNVETYETEEEVYKLFDFDFEQWSALCNTNAQIFH